MITHFNQQVDLIIQHCAEYYKVNKQAIYDYVDQKDVNRARRMAMYLAKEITGFSFPRLAKAFRRKHHTTIMLAHGKTLKWMNEGYKLVENQAWDIKEILLENGIDELSVPAGFQKA